MIRLPPVAALLGALLALAAASDAVAARPPPTLEPLDRAVCRLIEDAAAANQLPVEFVTRLIWSESSFRTHAVSPKGALGIAQFMPGTAAERGLADPFDPEQAIPQAARLLADLRRQFGSLAHAAAAYNAGPARVAQWLRGDADLPAETRLFVRLVTGPTTAAPPAGGANPEHDNAATPLPMACLAVIADLRRFTGPEAEPATTEPDFAPLSPWGVQLAGNFSKARALASFERTRNRYAAVLAELRPMIIGRLLRSRGTRRFYQVRLPAASRVEADTLCHRIRAVGGVCVVLRS